MPPNGQQPTDAQRAVAAHGEGPLLVLGAAGSGRTRGAGAAARGAGRRAASRPEHVLVLSRSRAARSRLRERAETLLDRPHEELWIHTYEEAAEALLREYSTEAGLDPFFTTVGPADRLAILLDRVDELPLRRHEIRGNPAGPARAPAAPDRPAQGRGGGARRRCASGRSRASAPPPTPPSASGPSARSSSPTSTRATTGSCARPAASTAATWCSSWASCCATAPTSPPRSRARFAQRARRRARGRRDRPPRGCSRRSARTATSVCACDPDQATRRFRGAGEAALAALPRRPPGAAEIDLGAPLRTPGVTRFWRCENDRAQAQAVAREVEHLLAAGEVRAERICVIAGSGWREGRLVAAALEERSVPFRFAGDAAFFQRPEVRDVLAWLRMLADPNDAAAVVRTLTRPPGRPALGRPREGDDDRPAAQARHDLGARGGAREPAAAARGPRPDPVLPAPPPRRRRTRSSRCAPTSSSAA